MAKLPRLLSSRWEYRIARALLALPPSLRRVVAGPVPVVEGQRLDPDIHLVLRLGQLIGDSTLSGVTVEEARARNRRTTAVLSGPPIPVADVEDLSLPGPAGPIAARLYRPFGRWNAPAPLVVYYHGGGFVIGDLDTQDVICRFLCAESDVSVLSVDYRLAPEHPFPAAAEDASAAFTWARGQAAELGADPQRLAVAGDSAGANLAAGVCLAVRGDDGPQPAMQLLIYPVTDAVERRPSRQLFAEGFYLTSDDMDWFEGHYITAPDLLHDPRASVLRAEDLSNLPPAYIATGGFDPLRDDGEAYALRLREAGTPVVLQCHPGLTHGFANLLAVSRAARFAMHEIVGALRMGVAAPQPAAGQRARRGRRRRAAA